MNLVKLLLTCAGVVLATWGSTQAGPITVTSQMAQSYAAKYDFDLNGWDYVLTSYAGTALDGVDHSSTSIHANGSHTTTANLSETSQAATFDYSFGGSMAGLATATLATAAVQFTATGSNLSYSISGDYSYTYPEPHGGFNESSSAFFSVYLLDMTTNTMLFINSQNSYFLTGPVNYVVGGTDGNSNTLAGSLNGLLISGHQYEMVFGTDDRAGNQAQAFTTTGNVVLNITSDVAEVPEPASLTLLGLGSLGLLAVRRRRQIAA